MADYGAIGVGRSEQFYSQVFTARSTLSIIRASVGVIATAVHGVQTRRYVSGTVKQDTTLVSRLVRAYNRATGEMLASGTSSGVDGTFSLDVGPFTGKVFVIAFDDTGTAPDYNAAIFDLVTPA